MDKILDEKRNYPRVKTHLKLESAHTIVGESTDLSENGMAFQSKEIISSPAISLQVNFLNSQLKIKTKVKLVWERSLDESNSMYGVEFINLKEKEKAALRKEIIRTQIKELLDKITDAETKKYVLHFFLKDLLTYINEVIKLNSQLSKEGKYSLALQKQLEHINTKILLKGYCLDLLLSNKKVIGKVKENFRALVGTWVYKGRIMKRAFEKPRGYSGDYRLLENIYNNLSLSEGIGKYYDRYFLNSPYAVALRMRKDRLRDILHEFIIANIKKPSINILNLACGSCREIAELFSEVKYIKYKYNSQITFSCVDRDEEAIDFSRKLFKNLPPNIKVKFLKKDLLEMIKDEKKFYGLGEQDLIYSIGLIDYFPDRILKKWLQFFYRLLRKNGKFILTHKNKEKTFPPLSPDWFCDWRFVPRSKSEVIELFHKVLRGFSLDVSTDNFSYIFYFTITKDKD